MKSTGNNCRNCGSTWCSFRGTGLIDYCTGWSPIQSNYTCTNTSLRPSTFSDIIQSLNKSKEILMDKTSAIIRLNEIKQEEALLRAELTRIEREEREVRKNKAAERFEKVKQNSDLILSLTEHECESCTDEANNHTRCSKCALIKVLREGVPTGAKLSIFVDIDDEIV